MIALIEMYLPLTSALVFAAFLSFSWTGNLAWVVRLLLALMSAANLLVFWESMR